MSHVLAPICFDCGGTEHIRLVCDLCWQERCDRSTDHAALITLLADVRQRHPDVEMEPKKQTKKHENRGLGVF